MQIIKNSTQPSVKGPADWFTGKVQIAPLLQANDVSNTLGAIVTFEPGARTVWHTHPQGQTLIVSTGCGQVQRRGGLVAKIKPGDVVWISPGEKHGHGASPATPMTHITIQEQRDGSRVEWQEPVGDEPYLA